MGTKVVMGTKVPHSAPRLDDSACRYSAWFPKLLACRFCVSREPLVFLNV